jgi:hypothetical protein
MAWRGASTPAWYSRELSSRSDITPRRLHHDTGWRELSRDGVYRNRNGFFLRTTTIQPELERFVAKRMGATVFETDSSRVPMLSQADFVLDVIRKAATAVQKNKVA